MKDQTREARELRKAALSHVAALRWILRRLETLGVEPRVLVIRVLSHETVWVTGPGVTHNPKAWADIEGVWEKARGEGKAALQDVERTRKEILGAST